MRNLTKRETASRILAQARAFGASLAGLAAVTDLQQAPSFTLAPRPVGAGAGGGGAGSDWNPTPETPLWPQGARSVLVVALAHPAEKPELDWWFGRRDPPGNRILAGIVGRLCDWLAAGGEIRAVHLPYHLEKGGTYLKDAAVLAGMGCIGRNNLLVTPEYGPRVRLRALTLDRRLPSSGPIRFDPCRGCDDRCRRACPQDAFGHPPARAAARDRLRLPARTGVYGRAACNRQMEMDVAAAVAETVAGFDNPVKLIRYCRRCELSCPAGRKA
jgi:epoxyqueuosine reductase